MNRVIMHLHSLLLFTSESFLNMDQQLKPLIKWGWLRALLFIIAVVGAVMLAQTLALLIPNIADEGLNEQTKSLINFSVTYGIIAALALALTWIFRKIIDRKSFAELGFQIKGYKNEAMLGIFISIALLGIGTIALIILGYLVFTGYNFDGSALLLELAILLMVSLTEEVIFRGYILHNLLQSMNKWVALLITSILFGLFHSSNPDVSVLAIVNVVLAGVVLGLNYIYTQNLWFGIGFHFAWNFFQGPILGYDVSGLELQSIFQQTLMGPELFTGGAFGFEASLLCTILLSMAAAYLAYLFATMYKQILYDNQAIR